MNKVCLTCDMIFDDAYRTTICPHETFAANDGTNNFRHHPESTLRRAKPTEQLYEIDKFWIEEAKEITQDEWAKFKCK